MGEEDDWDSTYWAWRDEQLKHPDGRAKGGEPCLVCGNPVPSNAHWSHRDRHACSSTCSSTLSRRFGRRAKRGEIQPPRTIDRWPDREPLLFATDEGADFPLQIYGPSPRWGDVLERYGQVTVYGPMPDEDGNPRPDFTVVTHVASTSLLVVGRQTSGYLGAGFHFGLAPDDTKFGGPVQESPVSFVHEGVTYWWNRELVRDIGPDGIDYTWIAYSCTTEPLVYDDWTPAYRARSEALRRISASTARHVRRQRIAEVPHERIDPLVVHERCGWVCMLCGEPIDPSLKAPDRMSATIDHIVPLAAGGSHTLDNVQSAHWSCNSRKGASTID